MASETQEHVYTCCHWSSRKKQDKELALLLQWMTTKNYHPHMIHKIISNMSAWMKGKEHKPPSRTYTPSSIRDIIDTATINQQEIGWWHMLQGRMSKKWEEAHKRHTTQQKERSLDGKTTLIPSLIRQLWRVAEVLWKTRSKNKHETNPK